MCALLQALSNILFNKVTQNNRTYLGSCRVELVGHTRRRACAVEADSRKLGILRNGGLQSMGSHRVGHDLAEATAAASSTSLIEIKCIPVGCTFQLVSQIMVSRPVEQAPPVCL